MVWLNGRADEYGIGSGCGTKPWSFVIPDRERSY